MDVIEKDGFDTFGQFVFQMCVFEKPSARELVEVVAWVVSLVDVVQHIVGCANAVGGKAGFWSS